jgi:DNA-directed RNA polymerase specialized sigma24 family protein
MHKRNGGRSVSDAEDVVQEAFIRRVKAGRRDVREPEA